MIEITSLCGQICLGKQGENLARKVCFDEPAMWKEAFGKGKCELVHQRSGDEAPYPVVLNVENDKVSWKITNADTAIVGDGKCELHYIVDDVVVKSKIWTTTVLPSLGGAIEEAPEPQKAWVDQVLNAAEEVEKNAKQTAKDVETTKTNAEESETSAEKAETHKNDAEDYAEQASTSEKNAKEAQQKAEEAKQGAEQAYQSTLEEVNIAAWYANEATQAEENTKKYSEEAKQAEENAKRSAEEATTSSKITQNTPFVLTDERAKTVSLVGEAETEYKYSVLSETIRSYKDTTISCAYMTEEPYLYGKRYVKNADAPSSWSNTYVNMKFDNLNIGQEYTFCIDSRKAGNLFTTIYVCVYDDKWNVLNGASGDLYYYRYQQDKMYTAKFIIPDGHQPYVNVRLFARGESTNVIFDNIYINRANTDNLYHTERIEEYGTFTEKKDFDNIVKGAEFSTTPECNGVISLDLTKETNIPISKFQGKTMVCFGDSITGHFTAPTDYPSIIAQNTGMTVYNCGFGGCRMGKHPIGGYNDFSMYRLADAITTGDFSIQDESIAEGNGIPYVQEHLNTLKSIDWANVDYISIAYGTNDIQGGNAVDNGENPLDTNTYLGAFRYSIEKIMTKYPHIKILALTPIYRFYPDTGEDSDSTLYANNQKFTEWGDGLIEASGELKIPSVDMYRTLCINKYNRTLYFPYNDGTHPNSIGRKAIGEKITARMSAEF